LTRVLLLHLQLDLLPQASGLDEDLVELAEDCLELRRSQRSPRSITHSAGKDSPPKIGRKAHQVNALTQTTAQNRAELRRPVPHVVS
jgi:hypothetical protein